MSEISLDPDTGHRVAVIMDIVGGSTDGEPFPTWATAAPDGALIFFTVTTPIQDVLARLNVDRVRGCIHCGAAVRRLRTRRGNLCAFTLDGMIHHQSCLSFARRHLSPYDEAWV